MDMQLQPAEKIFVELGPTQTENWGMAVIVEAATGIFYRNQVGGHSCAGTEAEGFLVPVGNRDQEHNLSRWRIEAFGGWCEYDPKQWTAARRETLRSLIAEIPIWTTDATGKSEPHTLELDETRMDACVEAWVPVRTPFGKGTLTFTNSD